MTLINGELTKQTAFERILDEVLNARRLLILSTVLLLLSVGATPLAVYFDFAYFTAKSMPGWLSVLNYLCVFGVLLSGVALILLGLASGIAKSHDQSHDIQ